jgi:hypothetical protein
MNRPCGLRRSRVFLFLGLVLFGSALASEPQALNQRAALRDFGSWQELTAGPYKVSPQVSTLCVTGFDHPGELVLNGGDHFIRVYANPQAHPLMRSPRGPKFPVGSVIAKAKLKTGSTRPVAVAFMVKHEAGYSPESLDWEFLFFEGAPLRQKALSAGSRCQDCHGNLTEGDGVFGSYLAERQGR